MKFKIIFTNGATLEFQGASRQLLDNYLSFVRGQSSDAQRYPGPGGGELVLDFRQVAAVLMNG